MKLEHKFTRHFLTLLNCFFWLPLAKKLMEGIRTHARIQIFHISCWQLFLIKAWISNTVVYRKARPNSSRNIHDWCNPNSPSFLSLSCLHDCYFSFHKSCASVLSLPRQRHLTAGRAPGKYPEGLRRAECNCFNFCTSENLHTENSEPWFERFNVVIH